jgi:2-dehydro-3-deoxyphosphooctonate aldolase (KDO 8-P synthase)
MKTISIGNLKVGPGQPFLIIAGPCVIESWDVAFKTAQFLNDLSRQLSFSFVFKSSYDKANRTSVNSFRGPGLTEGLALLAEIKTKLGVYLLSDVHETSHCQPAGQVLDVLQIPAFLCRQTDLISAAADTGKAINIKKGQFVSPAEMKNGIKKVQERDNENVFITERGTTFGYNNLVVDMRSIPIIKGFDVPVIFDATHSVQLPGGSGEKSGGERQYIPTLAKAAVAAGCNGLFMEVHPDPDQAKSDAATQIPLNQVKELISQCLKLHELASSFSDIQLAAPGQCQAAVASR